MSEPEPSTEPEIKHRILIEFIFETQRFLWRKKTYPVQHVPFKFGLRVTNVSDIPFPGATISRFGLRSATIAHAYTTGKKYSVHPLNPNEHIELWFGETSTLMEGSIWAFCDIVPQKPSHVVETFQKEKSTGRLESCGEPPNTWIESQYVQRQMELLQARTNFLILTLTVLILLETVFGIKNILICLLCAARFLLLAIADAIA